MSKPSKSQILEWTENPVTLYFRQVVTEERDFFMSGKCVDTYHPFEPHKTQEIIANLNGSCDSLSWILRMVEGELAEEAENEVRDIA